MSDNNPSSKPVPVPPPPPCRLLVRSKQSLELFTCHDPSSLTLSTENDTKTNKDNDRQVLLQDTPTTFQQLSPNGSFVLVHVTGRGIIKINLSSTSFSSSSSSSEEQQQLLFPDTSNVQLMSISPNGTYAVTWERLHPEKCNYNLKVWDCRNGTLQTSFQQKSLSRESWPYIQWTYDEQIALMLTNNNQIRIYQANVFHNATVTNPETGAKETIQPRYIHSINIKGCSSFTVPQNHDTSNQPTTSKEGSFSYYLSAFVPVNKDKPATAFVYEVAVTTVTTSENESVAVTTELSCTNKKIASKSLFQAESCSTYWSPTNDSVLLTLQTSIDKTGQSYYGNSQIFLWNHRSSTQNDITAVPLPQNGPILSVEWVPNPTNTVVSTTPTPTTSSFIVVAGPMPSMTSLHNGTSGQPLFQFGTGSHRNTVKIAPHGRFMLLGGFGNLAGGISFWDLSKKQLLPHNVLNVNGTLRAEACIVCEWSPSSRLFVVATTSPRMNVDNNIRLFRYTGDEIDPSTLPWTKDQYKPDKLLQVAFVPATSKRQYPDRPQSPVQRTSTTTTNGGGMNNTNGYAPSTVPATTAAVTTAAASSSSSSGVGKYVPPSARGRMMGGGGGIPGMSSSTASSGGGNSLAERMRREKMGSVQTAGRVISVVPTGPISALTGKPIPGLSGSSGTTTAAAANASNAKSKSAAKREKQKAAAAAASKKDAVVSTAAATTTTTTTASSSGTTSSAANSTEPSSDAVGDIEKKIRKIKKTLKQIDELKAKDSTTLNEEQKAKMASEFDLLQQLESLMK